MNRTGSMVVLAVVSSVAAGSATAQLPGIPYGPVQTGLGLSISADYGKPNDDAGGGSAYGVTAGLGFSRFGISASLGAWDPDAVTDAGISYAGRLGMKLFGGGLNPLTVGAQVAVSSVSLDFGGVTGDQRQTAFLPGVFARINPPLFPLKPWANVYYVTGDNVSFEEVRVAAGLDFNLLLGFGVHAGYDWGNDGGSTLGVGAHFTFRVPGLGVPGVPGM